MRAAHRRASRPGILRLGILRLGALALAASAGLSSIAMAQQPDSAAPKEWPLHSMERPRPPVVTPAPAGAPVPPPSDAIVLLDGAGRARGLAEWEGAGGGPARWTVHDGYVEVAPGTGSIRTKRAFGSVQLHVEWAVPTPPRGESQERGNSGVFLMSHYEVQILDSWHNDTYPDGWVAAIYGQTPPLVSAARRPGEWQTYDIVFHRPLFAPDGRVLRPATITVLHNGVLVQDHTVITGWTEHDHRATYKPHPDRLPLVLQDHENPTRFRNVWVRELSE
ncbi:MAG TPA: DUF1080 domain-containing protein [Gemmatimonadales bacterium]|nr:DUF1080 domain-containing protein [Gemmatimonadales bacterium]